MEILKDNLNQHTEKMGNYYYNKELNDKEDYCIYTDTDSVFYPSIPLVKYISPIVGINKISP